MDKTNIAKNKAHGIEPPKDAAATISHILSDAIGSKLHKAGPIINLVTSKFAGGSGHGHGHGSGGFNFGAFLGGASGGDGHHGGEHHSSGSGYAA